MWEELLEEELEEELEDEETDFDIDTDCSVYGSLLVLTSSVVFSRDRIVVVVDCNFLSSTRCMIVAISSFNSLMFCASTLISSSLAEIVSWVSLASCTDSIRTSVPPSTGGISLPPTATDPDPFFVPISIGPCWLFSSGLLVSPSASFVPWSSIVSSDSGTSGPIVVTASAVVMVAGS